jgi:hypothetical protein
MGCEARKIPAVGEVFFLEGNVPILVCCSIERVGAQVPSFDNLQICHEITKESSKIFSNLNLGNFRSSAGV